MARLPFEYHPEATAEAKAAYTWYAQQNETAAERFWLELVEARQEICDRPRTWPPYFAKTRCFRFRRFPYVLVYLEWPLACALQHDGSDVATAIERMPKCK